MSTQLTISSAFSILAMALFALSSPDNATSPNGAYEFGGVAQVSATPLPASLKLLPGQR